MAGAVGGFVGNVVGHAVGSMLTSSLSSSIMRFGMSPMAGAFANAFLSSFATEMKMIINNGPIPQFMKEAANHVIDHVVSTGLQPTTPEAQDVVNNEYGDPVMQAAVNTARNAAEEAEGKEGGNWLVALAGALAETQSHFLNKAEVNRQTMLDEVDSEDSKLFLKAQSEFQANMQMFNMMANMTATSLKSLGEGMTAIARKQ